MTKEERKQYNAEYKKNNKEKIAKQKAEYRKVNKEKIVEGRKKFYKANKEKVDTYNAEYHKANKEKIAEKRAIYKKVNKEKIASKGREYQKNNKGLINSLVAKRKAKKLQATPKWANISVIREIYKRASEMTKATGISYHVDHIVPLQGKNVSGLHVDYNLQILTATENCRKKNKH